MKRGGLVFVPREPPKRVILYPTQDSANQQQQQQQQQVNGSSVRAKSAFVTTNLREAVEKATNNIRVSGQQLISSPMNNTSKLPEKSENDKPVANGSGQPTSNNTGQRLQIPYSSNPFFRPKVIPNPNPQPITNTSLQTPNRDSPMANINSSIPINTSLPATIIANRERQSMSAKTHGQTILHNGRPQEPEAQASSSSQVSSSQEDSRRWAHAVPPAPSGGRSIIDERSNGTSKQIETNTIVLTKNESLKPKATSATDIVISLMDTWRAPVNIGNSTGINIFPRTGIVKDDSTIPNQTSASGEHLPNTPPFLTADTSSSASHNNQNWKKALLANFQKNSRNNPTAKLFTSKQTAAPSQPSIALNNDTTLNQQKNERTMNFNGIGNERTFQASETTRTIPSLIRKSSENIRVTKQDDSNNNNNNIERSTSLQIPASPYNNPVITTINETEEPAQPVETSVQENITHMPISIPTSLITPKPPASVDQQRAIITRVMIRRDFVKTAESRPMMSMSANIHSFTSARSVRPGTVPASNVIQVATITENNAAINSMSNNNRLNPSQAPLLTPQQQLLQQQQRQQYPQPTMPLSQKSLLTFAQTNATIKESNKIDNNQPVSSFTNDTMTSSSIMKMQQSQVPLSTNIAFRSSSLSATNAESRRKKEEFANKMKKRAISASAASSDE